ncbi:NAD(P) transhydrogenase subunit alpha [Rhodothalassium salexigens]|uniref:Re/Si-specific NAD(P)(+) transhydrogenase subunit alpha n=1 Tax=Rhodothalassium salexigens TaxID=1086 RepID=UPI00191212DB|nr:Re/Si-specific NAD(P)(+) transhydrogenase subunit alpha [Rhodothalassium salexigens]MBK5912542.1 NAD(P) transhydrogenase subunit alpha [Rhodothalassium salexigens]MBK5920811.1 NAD(P) transhydrogenase subunit alpha [Rhodothalassium salexigens]
MRVAVVKERLDGEKRVAATPETVKKLAGREIEVVVEAGAGFAAGFRDQAYKDAGATVAEDREQTLKGAQVILTVRGLAKDELEPVDKGALLVGLINPYQNGALVKAYADKGVLACAMEFVPRITRAQAMDVLSSQSNLAGYKAVLDAAEHFPRAMPMMMTAAGTIAPAKVFVMGAGVAGLQAIATARRLGAVVSATDVRPAAKEQVESLGGKFVMVDSEEAREAETAGGYAKEMSDDFKQKQAELVAETIKKQEIVITTALIPGKKAPTLINAEMVRSMKPGSVIVDLAVEQGGNCTLSKTGEVVLDEKSGVTIVGHTNVPSRLPADASSLYAKNLLNFLDLLTAKGKDLDIDFEDDIVQGVLLTKDGGVVHPNLAKAA